MDSNQNIQVSHFGYEREAFRPLDHHNHDMTEGFYCASHQEDFPSEKNLRPAESSATVRSNMKELVSEKNDLITKLAKLEKNEAPGTPEASSAETAEDKKKRFRRVATEIDRHYRCPVQNCQKSYGSEGSLNQHIKLKHPELVKDPDFKSKLSQKDSELQQQQSEATK